jgi:hypothetical protein
LLLQNRVLVGIAATNAFGGHREVNHTVIPRAIFTGPQVAVVGLTDRQAVARGHRCACRTIARCRQTSECRNRALFRPAERRIPRNQDSLAERGEIELPIPISEQSDYNEMSEFAGAQTNCRDGPRLKHLQKK